MVAHQNLGLSVKVRILAGQLEKLEGREFQAAIISEVGGAVPAEGGEGLAIMVLPKRYFIAFGIPTEPKASVGRIHASQLLTLPFDT